MEYLEENLTKYVQNLYTIPNTDRKTKDLNNWKNMLLLIGRLHIVKISTFPKLIHIFNLIPLKNLCSCFRKMHRYLPEK